LAAARRRAAAAADNVAPMMPPSVAAWRDGGRFVSTHAGSIFVRSGNGDGPTLLLLHGYPSSSFDYRGVVSHLADRAWLTMDFLGFGLSDKPRPHRYSLFEQADLVQRVVAETTEGPVELIAHDMGTSVATELLARDLAGQLPFDLHRAVLTIGSVILERASLRPIQKILRGPLGPVVARFANRRMFARGFARLFSVDHPLTPEEADAQWALMAYNNGAEISHLLISYLDERVQNASRWHGAVRDWQKPLSFLWGLDDPVATTEVLDGLRQLRPHAAVIQLPGVGHYPQVEVPQEFTAGALRLLDSSR
jgi:pimeloyl-ACP methyl ester carboxylesterase